MFYIGTPCFNITYEYNITWISIVCWVFSRHLGKLTWAGELLHTQNNLLISWLFILNFQTQYDYVDTLGINVCLSFSYISANNIKFWIQFHMEMLYCFWFFDIWQWYLIRKRKYISIELTKWNQSLWQNLQLCCCHVWYPSPVKEILMFN